MLSNINKGNETMCFPFYKYGYLFKLVEIEDAEFILRLRNNPELSAHLSETSTKIELQKEWIKEYKKRERRGIEYYIICIDPKTNRKLGLNRIYNITSSEFEVGSWLYEPNLEISTSIIGDIIARSFGFEFLNVDICVFNVRKENKSVLRYHLGYKPEIVNEDEKNIFFKLSEEAFKFQKYKLLKILGYE